jgi:type IV pilus assembly protein PilV
MKSNCLRTSAGGFTLVEMMVAMVVLAIGLLGIARLSLSTVQGNGSAAMRSQATELIQQIVDDMRANEPLAITGGYNIGLGANPGSPQNCLSASSPCTAAQIATFDLARWVQDLSTYLPGGVGQVTVAQATNPTTGSPENQATIVVQWNDSVAQNALANGTAPTVTTQTVQMETML